MPPLPGQFLYIHVPFCEQRCSYCDFYTVTTAGTRHELSDVWLELVAAEMDMLVEARELSRDVPIRTIFFGGGTPSLSSPAAVRGFMERVRSAYSIHPLAEITMEMQPGTADAPTLEQFAAAGINRFSIGVQTFSDARLRATGRRHSADQSRELLRLTARLGTQSLDLISTLPGQTFEDWKREIEEALSFEVPHISVYELTFHPGTAMTRRLHAEQIQRADEDLRIAVFEYTAERLIGAGYEHYEVSNFAKPGARSVHNENYWRLGDYAGLGAGAHSFLHGRRYTNAPDVHAYAAAIGDRRLFRTEMPPTDPDVQMVENLYMGLRVSEGLDLEWFQSQFAWDIRTSRASRLHDLVQEQLIEMDAHSIRLTPAGRLRFDSVLEYLL